MSGGKDMKNKLKTLLGFVCAVVMLTALQVQAATKKPNILVIWGDDIG
jgi:hypothetical protein